jgi:hypothetical protein
MKPEMNKFKRLASEYNSVRRILRARDFLVLLGATIAGAPDVARTGVLTEVDRRMSRNLCVNFRGAEVVMPVADIDRLLAGTNDSPTFGTIREMFARDCYFNGLNLPSTADAVLDLGANRGVFSLLALILMHAKRVIGVEPSTKYEPIAQLLLEANDLRASRSVRYNRFVGSRSSEGANPASFISVQTISEQQRISRFDMVKIDIEGGEKDLFGEPEWLSLVDNLAMEVHPTMVGDLSCIPIALERYGFQFRMVNQAGEPRNINEAMFLYGSRTGALKA